MDAKLLSTELFTGGRPTVVLLGVQISSFAMDESVGWLMQVSLGLFAFTPHWANLQQAAHIEIRTPLY